MAALRADGFRLSLLVMGLMALLLGGWSCWFFGSRLTLYEVSARSRLEVSGQVHAVQAPLAGRVVKTYLELGRKVQRGDLLVELDSTTQRLQLEEVRTRLTTLKQRRASIQLVLAAEQKAALAARQAARTDVDEAQARLRKGKVLASYSKEKARRISRLHSGGQMSEADYLKAQADAKKEQASLETLRIGISRLEKKTATQQSDRKSRLACLAGEVVTLQGQLSTTGATISRLAHEIRRRRIHAPVTGRVGELELLRAGSYVLEGDKICSVVPAGRLRVVGFFQPQHSMGRIRRGQPARLRLHGFSWLQYGSIPLRVSRVASEPTSDGIRVELTVNRGPRPGVPLQHGLPGIVEVEVEQVTPALLVLRTAGKMISVSGPSGSGRPELSGAGIAP